MYCFIYFIHWYYSTNYINISGFLWTTINWSRHSRLILDVIHSDIRLSLCHSALKNWTTRELLSSCNFEWKVYHYLHRKWRSVAAMTTADYTKTTRLNTGRIINWRQSTDKLLGIVPSLSSKFTPRFSLKAIFTPPSLESFE